MAIPFGVGSVPQMTSPPTPPMADVPNTAQPAMSTDPIYGKMVRLEDVQRKEFASTIKDRIAKGVSAYQPRKDKIVEADKYWMGKHWEDDGIDPWMPKPVENWVFGTVEQHSSNLTTANIVPIITGQDPGDDDIATLFDYVVKYLWTPNKLNMRRVIRRSIHTALKAGSSLAKVYWDPSVNGGRQFKEVRSFVNPIDNSTFPVPHTLFKGEVIVEVVDPINVIPDPAGYELSGPGACNWIAIRTPRSKDWIANNQLFLNYLGQFELNAIMERTGGSAGSTRSTTEQYFGRTINNPDSKDPMLDEVWIRRIDQYGRWHIDLAYLMDAELLFYAQDIYADGEFPFAILHDYEVDKYFFGLGEADQVIPNNNTINQINRLAALNAMHMTNTQKIVTTDSGIDPDEVAKFGTMPGAVWRSRTVDGLKTLDYKEIPSTMFKVAETAREGIRTIMAMDEANMGQFGGSVTAASGIKMIQDKANVRDQDKGMNVEDFVSRVTSLVISRVKQFYTTERYIPILDKNNQAALQQRFFPFLGVAYEDVPLYVTVEAGSGIPVNKQMIAQRAWEMFVKQGEMKYDPPLITVEELLDCLDGFPIKEVIKKRIQDAALGKQAQEAIEIAKVMVMLIQNGVDPLTLPPDQLIALVQQVKAQQAAQGAMPPGQPTGAGQVPAQEPSGTQQPPDGGQ